MTDPGRRRVLLGAGVSVLVVVSAPLLASAAWGRDDRSTAAVYATALAAVAAIVAAAAVFLAWEVGRHRRLQGNPAPTPEADGGVTPTRPDHSIDTDSV